MFWAILLLPLKQDFDAISICIQGCTSAALTLHVVMIVGEEAIILLFSIQGLLASVWFKNYPVPNKWQNNTITLELMLLDCQKGRLICLDRFDFYIFTWMCHFKTRDLLYDVFDVSLEAPLRGLCYSWLFSGHQAQNNHLQLNAFLEQMLWQIQMEHM